MKAVVFPGQGSQKKGMGKELYEKSEIARSIYDKANDVLGYKFTDISFYADDNILTKTENSQLAIFLFSISAFKILKEKGINFNYGAGHSLGELTALCASNMINLEDAIKIVAMRGKLMAECDKESKGGMAAVLGLNPEKIKEICKEINSNNNDYVEAVNFNTPEQTVISGYKTTIEKISEKLKEAGAKRVIPLQVSGAFHSKLMEEASSKFKEFLSNFKFNDPDFTVISNYDVKPYTKDNIIDKLSNQMKSPVLWMDIINHLYNNGVKQIIEAGYTSILIPMINKTNPNIETIFWDKF